MSVNVRQLLHDAAPAPRQHVDVVALLDASMRRRRRRWIGVAGSTVVVVAILVGALFATTHETTSRRRIVVGAERASNAGVSVELPSGWQDLPRVATSDPSEVLIVGNAARPDTEPVAACNGSAPSPDGSVYVTIYEYPAGQTITNVPEVGGIGGGAEVPRPRPTDFTKAVALLHNCRPGRENRRGLDYVYVFLPFEDANRAFVAIIASTGDPDRALALAGRRVLNTLHVEPSPSP